MNTKNFSLTAKQFDIIYSLWAEYGPKQQLSKKNEKLIIELFFLEAPVLNLEQLKKIDYIFEQIPSSGRMSNQKKSKLY